MFAIIYAVLAEISTLESRIALFYDLEITDYAT